MKKNTLNYTLKVFENEKEVVSIQTHHLRRFTNELRRINWKELTTAYLRVSYGKNMENPGKTSNFYNDCFCDSKDQLLDMFDYFRFEEIS